MFVYKLNPKTGEKVGKEVKLFAAAVGNKRKRGSFNVVTSDDKTKILVNHISYNNKTKYFKDKYRLLDTDLKVLLEKEEKN